MIAASEVGVVYLARGAEGLAPLRRFLQSYCAQPPGLAHDLIIIFKAFPDDESRQQAGELFADVPHLSIDTNDLHFDIGAYLQAAKLTTHKKLCFLNTHSEILAPNWLAILRNGLEVVNASMVGASASYESMYDSIRLLVKLRWLVNDKKVRFSRLVADHYRFAFDPAGEPRWTSDIRWLNAGMTDYPLLAEDAPDYFGDPDLCAEFDRFWAGRIGADGDLAFVADFPLFPNPHLRSNGFIIDREELLSFFEEFRPDSKDDSFGFESGPHSVTARIKAAGRNVLLADRQGGYWSEQEWPRSRTFRLSRQEDLLIADKQTRRFDRMSSWEKTTHIAITWGDCVIGSKMHPFTLGSAFRSGQPIAVLPDYSDADDYGVRSSPIPAHNYIELLQFGTVSKPSVAEPEPTTPP